MRAAPLCRAACGILVGACKTTTLLVLYREITKPLVPLGKATTLLVEVLGLLCKGMVSVCCSHSCQLMCWGWHIEGIKTLLGMERMVVGSAHCCIWEPGQLAAGWRAVALRADLRFSCRARRPRASCGGTGA